MGLTLQGSRLRSAGLALLTAGLVFPAGPTRAASAPASSWDMVMEGGQRQCRLTLRGEYGAKGAAVAMPPGCHRAFPALNGVSLWSDRGDDKLQLEDVRGEPILIFTAEGQGFITTSPQGETYRLKPADGASRTNLQKAVALAPQTGEPAADVQKPTARKMATTSQKPDEVAGRYAVLREKTHDTGCMVTLDDKARGPANTFKARLAPACRDQGIVIFDPVGWQIVAGQLVLTARKGHTTELETQQDGSWMNSPKAGKTLSLKRI